MRQRVVRSYSCHGSSCVGCLRGFPCAAAPTDPPTIASVPKPPIDPLGRPVENPLSVSELELMLGEASRRSGWTSADEYDLLEVWGSRTASIYRCRGRRSGEDLVVKVGDDWSTDDARRLSEQLIALRSRLDLFDRANTRAAGLGEQPSGRLHAIRGGNRSVLHAPRHRTSGLGRCRRTRRHRSRSLRRRARAPPSGGGRARRGFGPRAREDAQRRELPSTSPDHHLEGRSDAGDGVRRRRAASVPDRGGGAGLGARSTD